ncbi:MAG: K+ transporter Trk [Phycisphaerae bacterium]|nr:MAG: K+ transporter Trk [Phycisphaerae bacterium]
MPKTPNAQARPVSVGHWVLVAMALAAAVALSLEYGFDEPPVSPIALLVVQMVAISTYVFSIVHAFWTSSSLRATLRRRWFDLVFLAIAGLLLSLEFNRSGQPLLRFGTVYVVTIQVFLVARILIGLVRWNLEMSQRQLHPSRWVVVTFACVIVVGGCLLALPKAMTPEARVRAEADIPRHLVVSLFTSTSATCVTGLAIYDTATDYSRFGQLIILGLIQLGGLGIMISSTMLGLLIGRNLSLKQSLVLQSDLHRETVGSLRSVGRFVILTTLVLEGIGAILCYPMFAAQFDGMSDRVFYSVFHAVSAFCNAGFALQSDSLVSMGDSWGVYVSIMPLIVLGGLGFPVLQDVWNRWMSRFAPKRSVDQSDAVFRWAQPARRRPMRLQLHSRIVLWSSLGLIVLPAIMFFLFESLDWKAGATMADASVNSAGVIKDMDWFERARGALFQSVTARTAGFNTVALDAESLSPGSRFLLMLLMFVGGSPASTAGGVKTVTVGILVLGLLSTLRKRDRIELFGRTIPRDLVERAGVLVVLMFALISSIVLALSLTETAALRDILFESVSACGTVGLSCGLSAKLTVPGQFIIMLGMFAGRLGPLTLMVALADKATSMPYEYPEERVTIG